MGLLPGVLANTTERIMKIYPIVGLLGLLTLAACQETDTEKIKPILLLKTGNFTTDGTTIPVGGRIKFGITATEGSAPLTNLRITRSSDGIKVVEHDEGMFITSGGLDKEFSSVKTPAETEVWEIMVMNANRDSAKKEITVFLGEGSAYGPINHYPSVKIGMQHNTEFPQFLDLHNGQVFTAITVQGAEETIDLVGFVYLTSGTMSPTLCCPAYSGSSSVTGHYPQIEQWAVRNSTLYDYYTSDNDLIDSTQFNAAQNDSLLVSAYLPGSTSGLCKYCYTGRIIPFKTHDGKYGLVRVLHADIVSTGFMELEIKVQE